MSIYTLQEEENPIDPMVTDENLYLTERSIYGSSRVGTENIRAVIASSYIDNININTDLVQTIGDRNYELSNHLGNVLEVITDRKLQIESTTTAGEVDYYVADVVAQNDYMPFGMLMINRHESAGDYRYGYQGSEMDNEVRESEGTSYTTTFRQLDPRVGRWLSIDPKATALESPYASMRNNPIMLNDVLGDTISIPNAADREQVLEMINSLTNKRFAIDADGNLYEETEFVGQGVIAPDKLGGQGEHGGSDYYSDKLLEAINSNLVIEIEIEQIAEEITGYQIGADGLTPEPIPGAKRIDLDASSGGGQTVGRAASNQRVLVTGNPNKNIKDTNGLPLRDEGAEILMHELVGHAIPHIVGTDTGNAVENENKVRQELNDTILGGPQPLRAAEPYHTE